MRNQNTSFRVNADRFKPYPLKLKPVYKDYLWGGRALEKYRSDLPEGIVAESWEVSCHPDGISIIDNGIYRGIALPDLISGTGKQIIGTALPQKYSERFPLLVKLIDANEKLSVQVHPDDRYAREHEHDEYGKSEAWYIISAKAGAELVYDVAKGTEKAAFAEALEKGCVEKHLRRISVSAGDVVYIPAGVVHAIGGGIFLAEIQQSSNATYRVYDYDRIGKDGSKRALHIEKALDVIDFSGAGKRKMHSGLKIEQNGSSRTFAVASRYFAVELFEIEASMDENTHLERFNILMFFNGKGAIEYNGGELSVQAGESVLIPAALGKYRVTGKVSGLKAYVPDLVRNIAAPLLSSGYTLEDIRGSIGGMEEI